MKVKEKLEEKIKEISEAWGKCPIYYVGGYVRDEILEEVSMDVDLVVDMENGGLEFAKFVSENYSDICNGFACYPRFGTAKFDLTISMPASSKISQSQRTFISRTFKIECVMPRSEEYADGPRKPSEVHYSGGIEGDSKRRDFCCNALYKNTITGEILDPTGHGIEDIKNKILRTPLDPEKTFTDDPLRMLRAIRFAARKGFTISDEVFQKIKPYPEYYKLSMERVRDEFSKIIISDQPSKYIWMLHDTGLLDYIIPELEDAWGFNQNSRYHAMNLTDHILSVVDKIKHGEETTRLAGLLHDISKYKIHQDKPDGTFSYYNHEVDSSKMARKILTRLKYPEATIADVCRLIENHMIIKQMYNYNTGKYTGNAKSTRKILNKFPNSKELDRLMELIDADNLSHSPEWNMPGQTQSFFEEVFKLRGYIQNSTLIAPVTGDDIMKRYGIGPGKQVGDIKEILQDLYLGNPENTKDDLFRIYEEEFYGKIIWIFKGIAGDECASIVEPIDAGGHFAGSYRTEDYKDTLVLDSGETFLEPGESIKTLSAMDFPSLYTRIRGHRTSRELFDTALDALEKLFNIPGFDGVDLILDSYGDASGKIMWKNHKTDIIY